MSPDPIPHGTWRTYTTTDGLAALRTQDIAADGSGTLWFATTTNGVCCFDGDCFTSFTIRDGLRSNEIYSIAIDGRGNPWFSGPGGVCWYDGQAFHYLKEKSWDNDLLFTSVFADRDGQIWFVGHSHNKDQNGAFGYWDGKELCDLSQRYNADCSSLKGPCWGITQDQAGYIWLAQGSPIRFDGQGFTVFGPDNGLPDSTWNIVFQPADEDMLLVGGQQNIGRYDGQRYEPIAAPIKGYIRRIQSDTAGRVWICDEGHGVLCLTQGCCHRFDFPSELPASVVTSVFTDREGLIWFATWGGGVACLDPLSIKRIDSRAGLPYPSVSVLAEDRAGRIWMGFGNISGPDAQSLAYWDGNQVVTWGETEGLATVDCMALHLHSSGDLYAGDWDGLLRYNGQSFERFGHEGDFICGRVYSLAEDQDGLLYIGHGTADKMQLSTFDGQHFTMLLSMPRNGLEYISAILKSRDATLWFGIGGLGGQSTKRGLGRLDHHNDLSIYTVADGLPANGVEALYQTADDTLWIATVDGLSRFDGTHFHNLTTHDGLPNNYIQCLLEDSEGHLWLGSETGVSCWDGTFCQTIYSEQIGPTYQILQGYNGTFWFATQRGLISYHPQRLPPDIRLERVIADRTYEATDVLEIAATGSIQFEYKGRAFRTHPHHMLYQYRLLGHDTDWQAPTRSRRAIYQDLSQGKYCFEVRAVDRDLNRSAPARLSLSLVPDSHTAALEEALSTAGPHSHFVGISPNLRQAQNLLNQVATTDMTVLILGETGTGKGIAARTVHQLSPRHHAPFIQINCGAIAENLVEAELFGHEKGAFTGALSRRLGKVEVAKGGSLFLDEIGDMPLNAQVKLLQFLQERTFERVGSSQVLEADVRIIAATNRDLQNMVKEGTFREDLYFRLQIFPVSLPPLRQRQEDIAILAHYFAERFGHHLDRPTPKLCPETLAHLQAYNWPGNVRELEHLIQRAVLLCKNNRITVEDIAVGVSAPVSPADVESSEAIPTLAEHKKLQATAERRLIKRALEATDWTIYGAKGAAQLLGLDPDKLRYWIRKYQLKRPR